MQPLARSRLIAAMLIVMLTLPSVLAAQEDVTLPPWRRELPGGRESVTITVGETPVDVDLAVTSGQQMLGLGYRNGLEPDTGMLFIDDEPRPRTFWMKGMRFCLDIIWIDDDRIVGAAENACPDPAGTADRDRARYSSGMPVTHVLELPAGWLEEHGYGPGTPVDLSALPGN